MKKHKPKTLSVSEKPHLPFQPGRLITLWEMIEYHVSKLISLRNALQGHGNQTNMSPDLAQNIEHLKNTRIVIARVTGWLLEESAMIELSQTEGRCKLFLKALQDCDTLWSAGGTKFKLDHLTPREIDREIRWIIKTLDSELKEKKFVFIPGGKSAYFEMDNLFGALVNKLFPSAQSEIKAAGNCMAADLNTAAIFHLMRVVELGLRALAYKLKVKLKHRLEDADWGAIITGIDLKLDVLQKTARGRKKTAALTFYRHAKDDCNLFKDVWRNNVMHTRRSYSEKEALAVYERVSEFMQRLCERVSETK